MVNVSWPSFEWSKAIEVGHSDIDAEHRQWFYFLRELREASDRDFLSTSARKIIDKLKYYIFMHFKNEEKIMDQFSYSNRDKHKLAHAAFIRKIDEVDGAKNLDADICKDISIFIYQWLVSHIARVDREMVLELNRGQHGAMSGGGKTSQTTTVIDGAFDAAAQIEQLSVRYRKERMRAHRLKLSRDLADASDRMINLMELAELRVETFGCNDNDLVRLRRIGAAIKKGVGCQLEPAAERLIEYGAGILAGRHGLPFGVGAELTLQLERIGSMLHMVGGFSELPDPVKDQLERAIEIANDVIVMEGKASAMPNFQTHPDVNEDQKGTGSVGGLKDQPFILMAQNASRKIGGLFGRALSDSQISLPDLFDETYVPIKGSNPQQYSTRFLAFADANLADLQESILEMDRSILFAVTVDRNGYLPTHNRKFAFPQGQDPEWNAAHCRNRRIFNDKTGLGAARNTSPLLLQTYLRDTGDVAIVRDASAPIWVNGLHWGAFRIGYPII